jgi:hypothetical protein
MAVLAVIAFAPKHVDKLAAAIEAAYPDNFMKVDDDAWLVSAKATPQEVSDKLGITTGVNGGGIVLAVSAYFGRATPNVWNWVKTKWEATTSG